MAVDEAVMVLGAKPTLRLYTWQPQPALSLGALQSHAEIPPSLRSRAVAIVRRMTGGGAILHSDGELTVSLGAALGDPEIPDGVREAYAMVHRVLRRALGAVGVEVDAEAPAIPYARDHPFDCFARATELDVTAAGVKIAGAAQRRVAGRFLEQVSIRHTPEVLAPALAEALEAELGLELEPGELSAAERDLADRLVEEKYASSSWTKRR